MYMSSSPCTCLHLSFLLLYFTLDFSSHAQKQTHTHTHTQENGRNFILHTFSLKVGMEIIMWDCEKHKNASSEYNTLTCI